MRRVTELSTLIGVVIGEEIRRIRKARGLTQEDLAKKLGSHREIVTRVESGKHCMTTENLIDYARALQVHPAYILQVLDYEI